VVVAFVALIAFGTVLLSLPMAWAGPGSADPVTALFTATSAVCVTGLVVVDTGTAWTGFGQFVILGLIQIGGFGIMAIGSLLVLLFSRRIGLRQRLLTGTETGLVSPTEVRRLIRSIAVVTAVVESTVSLLIAIRLVLLDGFGPGRALVWGVFHAISAFNNAGFALWSDSLTGFVTDVWMMVVVGTTVIIGGLGFPVLSDLGDHWRRPRSLTLHSRLTLATTLVLLVGATVVIVALEWSNPATLGALAPGERLVAGAFQALTPRTAGFNSIDYGLVEPATLLVTDGLMLIGAGSASTGGGIKVTTFAVLGFVVIAELRKDADVTLMGRRVSFDVVRQALAVALLAVGTVIVATIFLLVVAPIAPDDALFEAVSAFGTVGLSTGVTAELPTTAQLGLVLLMLVGRVGPVTAGVSFLFRRRLRRFRYPEEGLIVG
jgi:potassium uptake TrkH family protein